MHETVPGKSQCEEIRMPERVNHSITNEGGKFLVGIDIGGTKTAVVLSSRPPNVLARAEFPHATRQRSGTRP